MTEPEGDIPGLSPDALARAENALAALEGRWRRTARADCRALRLELNVLMDAAPGLDPAAGAARMFTLAHDMKGQAATFGFPEITELANRLCRRIEAAPRPGGDEPAEWAGLVAAIETALATLPADEG